LIFLEIFPKNTYKIQISSKSVVEIRIFPFRQTDRQTER